MPKAKPLPPLEELEQLLDYDHETGVFRWKIKNTNNCKNKEAGWIANGYRRIKINGACIFAHRLAWLFANKQDPGTADIDHINMDRLDNRPFNLRLATAQQNAWNTGIRLSNTSGYKGVSYHKKTGKWQANIQRKGKFSYLGLFPTPELAHMAYCKAAAELHGDFARGA